jgi:hypothetical protein
MAALDIDMGFLRKPVPEFARFVPKYQGFMASVLTTLFADS